jgi:hypothetical protein
VDILIRMCRVMQEGSDQELPEIQRDGQRDGTLASITSASTQ